MARAIEYELLNMHGDAQKRLSRLLTKALRDRVVEGMRRKIADIVSELVAGLPADGPVDFAAPLPTRCQRVCWGRSSASPMNRRRG